MELAIVDEIPGAIFSLGIKQFASPKITVRRLIRARVELEVEREQDSNLAAALTLKMHSNAAVIAGKKEARLNCSDRVFGPGSYFLQAKDGELQHDIDRLCDAAEQGFLRGRYFILLDDRQVESLSDEIDLVRTSEATFLLLTPLQGG